VLGKRQKSVGIGHDRADRHYAIGYGDRFQPVEIADKNRRRNRAHLLGHPQPDIGRSGDDGGIRLGFVDRCEIIHIRRNDQALPACAGLDARAAPHRGKPCGNCRALGRQRILCRLAVSGNRPGGAHDRLVAGAAAEIALQGLLYLRV
jgi:hypothetical protein